MAYENFKDVVNQAFSLLAEATLKIGFVEGTGLGAVFATIVAVSFFRSPAFMKSSLEKLIKAWRLPK